MVDKLGRRWTMISGAIGMAVCQLIVAITGTIIGQGDPAGQKVLVAFVCIYSAYSFPFIRPRPQGRTTLPVIPRPPTFPVSFRTHAP